MTEKGYQVIYDNYGRPSAIRVGLHGNAVLDNCYTNKGVAFDEKERADFGLSGSLPPSVKPLDLQIKKAQDIVDQKISDIEKYTFVRSLMDKNATLAHALIASDIRKFMAIVYTPTVGLACQQYSAMFRQAAGLHFYPGNIDQAEEILARYKNDGIRVAVVTDNQGILGIGDQGAGGLAICIGKLMLYTQGAGIAPWQCLPVSLDVGTDNMALLNDEKYLGWPHKRLTGDAYLAFVDRFVKAFKKVFPDALCQWEDFSKQNAFTVLDTHVDEVVSFNDDIQGTGAVTLSGILCAMKVKGESLKDQVFLIHGAGAGGVGVGAQIACALMQEGLTEAEAISRIYTLDSRGLVTTDRNIEPYKVRLAKDPSVLSWLNTPEDGQLVNVIQKAKVTVLIGTSGQSGCFTREVVEAVHRNTDRPVVFPLSNPTVNAEALPKDIYAWTDGKALVATGSPFAPVSHGGKEFRIGQCNNVFIFPGVGLGIIASGASKVLPSFFTAAAYAAADHVSDADLKQGTLFPPVEELRKVSVSVAKAVGRVAIAEGLSRKCAFSEFDHQNDPDRLDTAIENMGWKPEYLPLEK
jgi:malate dehydrogenase (oxaloacetate-decarboxylating)